MRSSNAKSSLPMLNPRTSRQNTTTDCGYLKDIINALLFLVALFLAGDLLLGWRKDYSTTAFDDQKESRVFDSPKLNCFRPLRLHNAFSSLCRPSQPGVVYSARFGGLGGWELEILHSGDFASAFHVFDPTPLISERQAGIEYHEMGLGLREENITLAPPLRPEHTYSFLGNHTGHESQDKILSVGVESLETLMRHFGHSHLGMLHLDLGGMETVLVDGWVRSGAILRVDQIVIRFGAKPFASHAQSNPIHDVAENMKKLGFKEIDAWETEFTFVQQDSVERGFWASREKRKSSRR